MISLSRYYHIMILNCAIGRTQHKQPAHQDQHSGGGVGLHQRSGGPGCGGPRGQRSQLRELGLLRQRLPGDHRPEGTDDLLLLQKHVSFLMSPSAFMYHVFFYVCFSLLNLKYITLSSINVLTLPLFSFTYLFYFITSIYCMSALDLY